MIFNEKIFYMAQWLKRVFKSQNYSLLICFEIWSVNRKIFKMRKQLNWNNKYCCLLVCRTSFNRPPSNFFLYIHELILCRIFGTLDIYDWPLWLKNKQQFVCCNNGFLSCLLPSWPLSNMQVKGFGKFQRHVFCWQGETLKNFLSYFFPPLKS